MGICGLIASDAAIWKVWVDGDHSITSIHYYDELYVQLVDGLLVDELIAVFAPRIADDASVQALLQFVRALHVVDSQIDGNPQLKEPAILLLSSEWRTFQQCAKYVVELPRSQEYRRGQKDQEILRRLKAEREMESSAG